MKTLSIKKLPGSKVDLEIELEAEKFNRAIETVIKSLSKDLEISGFRPGHIPNYLVEQKIGLVKIYQEAARIAISEAWQEILELEKIEPISLPQISITKMAKNNPLEFKAQVSVLPEIKLADYKKLHNKKRPIEVKEEEVKKALLWLVNSRTKLVTTQRAATKGDRVEITFETRKEGVKIENGQSRNHPLIIGEGKFVPGFEDNLVGLKVGEQKKFQLTFPLDYHRKDLAGKVVEFDVRMNLVQERQIPSLDDNFAQTLGKFKDLNQLEASIKEGLEIEKNQEEEERFHQELITTVANDTAVEAPDILIDYMLDRMVEDFKYRVSQSGLSVDTYLVQIKKTLADLRSEWRLEAIKRAKINLILREIAKRENIEVPPEEIKNEINNCLKNYSSVQETEKIDLPTLKEYIREVLINKKVFALLENIALKNSK